MIVYLIKSGLCLVILLGIYLLFLEREKMHQFNRFFLLLALVIGLTVPFISFEWFPDPETTSTETQYAAKLARSSAKVISVVTTTYSDFIEDVIEPEIEESNLKATKKIDPLIPPEEIAESTDEEQVNSSEPKEEKLSVIESRVRESTPPTIISFKDVIIGVYLVVTLFLFIRLINGVVGFYHKKRFNEIIKYGSAKIVLIEEPTVPHTFLNTIYVNKAQFESGELSKEILDHELTHARQKHSLDVLFIELLRLVFWFNPLFYFYKRAIQINHEFLADDFVITKTQDSVSYQKLLLNSIFPTYQTNLASTFNYSLTKKRFKMMVKDYSFMSVAMRKTLLIPMLAGIIFMFCTDIGTEKKIYEINGMEYVPAYFYDGHEANELVLIEYEERDNSWNPGVYKHYDRDGNLYTGELMLYDKESGRLQSKYEIKDGRLLLRVEYIDPPTGRFSMMRTIYSDEKESVGMYSPDNKLTGSISRINGSKFSMIDMTSLDSLDLWSDLFWMGEAKDSLASDTGLISTFTRDGFVESMKLSTQGDKNIPIKLRHVEVITDEAKEKYERAVIEYKRTLSNNVEDQLWYAYEELKLQRSRWLAFRRELYHNYKDEIASPIPPMPAYPIKNLTEEVTIEIKADNNLLVNGQSMTLDELESALIDLTESPELVRMNVSDNAKFGSVTDVQNVLRRQKVYRIIYNHQRSDSSVVLTLPPATTEEQTSLESQDIMRILMSSQALILMNSEPAQLNEVRKNVKGFLDDDSRDPSKVVFSIKTSPEAPYELYLELLEEIRSAINEMRDEATVNKFGSTFPNLAEDSPEREVIRKMFPMKVSAYSEDSNNKRSYKTPLHKEYAELSEKFDETEAIYLETKTDEDLIKYYNLYYQRSSLYTKLKEIDSAIKVPRPAVPVKREQYERVKNDIEDNSES
ncbi:MAG: M56 family metallopeptidase [Balneola sp.]|jgi:biopolymer transport protein ExbD